MLLAIIASGLLLKHPVLSFQEDKGIIYTRSFSMDAKVFYVIQTKLDTGAEEVTATMSVAGLYYTAWAMIITCIACLVCVLNPKWRMLLSVLAATIAGVYYILMIYYAIAITDNHYTTLYPNFYALLPAIALQCMLLVRRDVAREIAAENENEENEENEEEY